MHRGSVGRRCQRRGRRRPRCRHRRRCQRSGKSAHVRSRRPWGRHPASERCLRLRRSARCSKMCSGRRARRYARRPGWPCRTPTRSTLQPKRQPQPNVPRGGIVMRRELKASGSGRRTSCRGEAAGEQPRVPGERGRNSAKRRSRQLRFRRGSHRSSLQGSRCRVATDRASWRSRTTKGPQQLLQRRAGRHNTRRRHRPRQEQRRSKPRPEWRWRQAPRRVGRRAR